MASEMVKIEVWVVVDEEGDYAVSKHDATAAGDEYETANRPLAECEAVRRVKITILVPRPKAVEITATLGEEPGVGIVSVN